MKLINFYRNKLDVSIEQSWKKQLEEEFNKPYFEKLATFVKEAYIKDIVYPSGNRIFSAFDRCKWEDLKIVIIGQDPYHGPNQANGLSFSVSEGIPHPPSLVNIFKEIKNDLNIDVPISGNLERWADQGILLLNATLTVKANHAGSHQKQGWENFTDAVIKRISNQKEGVIFMLWGGFAQKKGKIIDSEKHFILTSGHPSPLSANRGFWFGNKHFSKANTILKNLGKKEMNW